MTQNIDKVYHCIVAICRYQAMGILKTSFLIITFRNIVVLEYIRKASLRCIPRIYLCIKLSIRFLD